MWLIDGWREIVPPMVLMALSFYVTPMRVKFCFLGAISVVEEVYEKAF